MLVVKIMCLSHMKSLSNFSPRYVYDRDPSDGSLSLKNNFSSKSISDIRFIDIGCGIRTQSQFLAQQGFTVHGYDVSDVAISRAQNRISYLGLQESANFSVINPQNFSISQPFDIGVACASLDSMPFACALEWMQMSREFCTNGGFFFATLIGPSVTGAAVKEEVVSDDLHESGTVQSYFDPDKIKTLFDNGGFSIIRLDYLQVNTLIPNTMSQRSSGRYSVVAVKS